MTHIKMSLRGGLTDSVEELDNLEVRLNEEFLKGGKSGVKKIEKTVDNLIY